jgi:hydrogenase expression/formation protein HypE
MTLKNDFAPVCPLPLDDGDAIQLAHGGSGTLTQRLIEGLFLPQFDNAWLSARHDGAVLSIGEQKLAFSTDSFVVRPLFFPGGDIGVLAVNGTVNDLAMCGAEPVYLSAGFILEEGFPMEQLRRVVASMAGAARRAGIKLVTGDTKVVDKGSGDGVFINTSGIGIVRTSAGISARRILPGDAVLLSGDVGRHGMAVMAVREGLEFEGPIESDTAALAEPVLALLAGGIDVRFLRDPTRGGLATALIEAAETAGRDIVIGEAAIPITPAVQGACEILGFDPLYVANEGRFIAIVPAEQQMPALDILRRHAVCQGACMIGTVAAGAAGTVTLKTTIGGERILDRLSGEQLPRIC